MLEPSHIRELVNSQRENYDPVSQSYCETHITVTQPLTKQLDEKKWVHIQRLLAEFMPFDIEYDPLNSFLPYPCIWYEIKPVDRILELRSALHDTGWFNLEMRHPENFILHMTITEGLSGLEVNDALLHSLQEESGAGSFLCEDFAFIVPDEHFQFHVHRRLPLGTQV